MGKIISFRSQQERHPLKRRPFTLFIDKVLTYRSHLLSANGMISSVSKQMKKEELVKPHSYFKLLEPVQQIEHTTRTFYEYLDCSPYVPAPIRSSRYALLVLVHTVELQARELSLLLTEAHLRALHISLPSLQDLRSRRDILSRIDQLIRGSRTIARQINGLVQQPDIQEEQLVHS